MPLPPPEKLAELATIFRTNAPKASDFEPFSVAKAKIAKYAKMAAITALQQGVQSGLSIASGVASTTVNVGMGSIALFPLGAALGPWFAALAIGLKADGIFALHDLRDSARGSGKAGYRCTCGKCAEHLTYVIDRKEANVAIMAVGVFTGGLAIIADRLNSVRKSFQKNRPKERICRGFIESARGGCTCSIASIMAICGNWGTDAAANNELAVEAIAIVWSSDGHDRLKSKW